MFPTKVKTSLSGNILKLIAAMAMLCDHIGLIFFSHAIWLRAIGRLAFPIFAFFISEGCRYTKNRAKYLCTMAILAAIFQIVYYFVMHTVYLSIFATFTLSILLVYLLDEWKKSLFEEKANTLK